MAAKRKNWDNKTLRAEITKWKKQFEIPINKEEIDHYKKKGSSQYIKPRYPVPTKASFTKFISRNTIKNWASGNEKQRALHEIYEQEVLAYIEDKLTQKTMESGKGAAGAMFLLKSTFHYSEYGKKEEQQPIIINIDTENKGDNKI